MRFEVLEAPRSTGFTTLARAKAMLSLPSDACEEDAAVARLVGEVSDDFASYTDRPWAREQRREWQEGHGTTQMYLELTPLLEFQQLTYCDTPVSGVRVQDPKAGSLFKDDRFVDTRPFDQWVERDPATESEGLLAYATTYIGGYLMPDDNAAYIGLMSASAVDGSFNLSATDTDQQRFPILVSGEVIVMKGFTDPANLGRFRVLSRTPSKLVVAAALVTETCSGIATVVCQTLPQNLEAAALDEIRARYQMAQRDPTIAQESIGDYSVTYEDPSTADAAHLGGLTVRVARKLSSYRRFE